MKKNNAKEGKQETQRANIFQLTEPSEFPSQDIFKPKQASKNFQRIESRFTHKMDEESDC